MDALVTAHGSGVAAWIENTDGLGQAWATRIISSDCPGASSIQRADFDQV
jgi:hypothetical protein